MNGLGMTGFRLNVLQSIDSLSRRLGYPPSYVEIAKDAGLRSTATVWKHMRALEVNGFIQRDGFYEMRSTKLTKKGRRFLAELGVARCPTCGRPSDVPTKTKEVA
jgi:SOS-response transcriptional repressor LexA